MRSRRRYSSSSMRCRPRPTRRWSTPSGALDALLAQAPLQHGQAVAHRPARLWRARAAMRSSSSSRVRTTISAAAEGVGARRSATKSAMVTSVSCPTAEITGTEQAAMARATASSLKVHRSSSDPPPRPTITTSGPLGPAEVLDAAADLLHRALALHQRREEADVQAGKAARENLDHVRDGRAARRGDDADAPRKARQRPLALGRRTGPRRPASS